MNWVELKTYYCFKYSTHMDTHTYNTFVIPETLTPKGKNLFGYLYAYLNTKTLEKGSVIRPKNIQQIYDCHTSRFNRDIPGFSAMSRCPFRFTVCPGKYQFYFFQMLKFKIRKQNYIKHPDYLTCSLSLKKFCWRDVTSWKVEYINLTVCQ